MDTQIAEIDIMTLLPLGIRKLERDIGQAMIRTRAKGERISLAEKEEVKPTAIWTS